MSSSPSSQQTPLQHTDEEDIVVPSSPPPLLITTWIRRGLTPYLPPPVVALMHNTIDPTLEQYVGPEASMTLLLTLLVTFVLWKVVSWMTNHANTSSTLGALQDDDDQDGISDLFLSDTTATTNYEETIVLCGPCQAGKTSLFYTLLYPDDSGVMAAVSTVSTLKPNAGIWYSPTTGTTTTTTTTINGEDNDDDDPTSKTKTATRTFRLLDTPGHWSPTKLLSTVGGQPQAQSYIWVVVLDATQPVTATVDYLYAVLALQPPQPKKILVVCTKADSPKAKNIRRLKLQIRKELERLESLNTTTNGDNTKNWEDVLTCQVEFVSTSVVMEGNKQSPSSSSFQKEMVSFLQRR